MIIPWLWFTLFLEGGPKWWPGISLVAPFSFANGRSSDGLLRHRQESPLGYCSFSMCVWGGGGAAQTQIYENEVKKALVAPEPEGEWPGPYGQMNCLKAPHGELPFGTVKVPTGLSFPMSCLDPFSPTSFHLLSSTSFLKREVEYFPSGTPRGPGCLSKKKILICTLSMLRGTLLTLHHVSGSNLKPRAVPEHSPGTN